MTEAEALDAVKLYLKNWNRHKAHDFDAFYIPANTSAIVDNRATWKVTLREPALGGEDVFTLYVDELTGEAWQTAMTYGGAKSPRSWDDAWAMKKVAQAQKKWDKKVKSYQRENEG